MTQKGKYQVMKMIFTSTSFLSWDKNLWTSAAQYAEQEPNKMAMNGTKVGWKSFLGGQECVF